MHTKHDYYDDQIAEDLFFQDVDKEDGETFWRAQVDLAQEMDEDAKKLSLIKDLLYIAETCIETITDIKKFTLPDRLENDILEGLDVDDILYSIQQITSEDQEDSFIDLERRKCAYVNEYHDSNFYKKSKLDYENWINSNLLRSKLA